MVPHSKWRTPESLFIDKPKWWHVNRPLHFALVFMALIVSITLTWYFWAPDSLREENIPLIKAKPGPIRVRPDSPGAPEIPHQDKRIYDELTSQKAPSTVITLRPQSEEPLDLPDPISPSPDGKTQEEGVPVALLQEDLRGFENQSLERIESEQKNPFERNLPPTPKLPKKEVRLRVPKVKKPLKNKIPKVPPLPLRKLFALKTPSIPLSMRRKGKKNQRSYDSKRLQPIQKPVRRSNRRRRV